MASPTWLTRSEIMRGDDWKAIAIINKYEALDIGLRKSVENRIVADHKILKGIYDKSN